MGGIAVLLGFVSFAFYLHGLYPSVSVGDSGEFIAAAHTLGIAHPPGFPVYSVLGHLFEAFMPWGNVAYRLNLFSAAAASGAMALMFITLRRAGVRTSYSIGATLLFALSPAMTANARTSEVFALNAVAVAAILACVVFRRWILSFFIAGMGAGNHQIILFLVPLLILALNYDAERSAADRRRRLFCGSLFFALGLTVYGVLMIRSARWPFLDVGHPDDWERLWRVISRADYGSLTLALGEMPARTVQNTFLQLNRLLSGSAQQCTWVILVAALAGLGRVNEKSRRTARLCGAFFFMLGPVFFLMGNLPFDAQSNGLLVRFLIAPTMALVILGALGFEVLYKESRWGAGLLLCFAVGWQIAHADGRGFRNDYTAYAYGRNNLRGLPPQAQFFMDGGDDTFYTLAYLTQVEGLRPDIHFCDRGGVVFASPYGPDFRALDRAAKEDRRQAVESDLVHAGQAVYYSTMNPKILKNVNLTQEGILYAARPHSIAGQSAALWPLYDLRGVPPWNAPVSALRNDYRTRALVPFYAYQYAIAAESAGQDDIAWHFLKQSQRTGIDVLWLQPNIVNTAHLWAYNAFNAKKYSFARDLYQWILKISPTDVAARQNLQLTENQLRHVAL